jgi:hypothetical protein
MFIEDQHSIPCMNFNSRRVIDEHVISTFGPECADYTIETHPFIRSQSANLYAGSRISDGKPVVLKTYPFYTLEKMRAIRESLRAQAELDPHEHLVEILAVPHFDEGYITARAQGINVHEIVSGQKTTWVSDFDGSLRARKTEPSTATFPNGDQDKGRVIIGYAKVLKHVHERGYLLGDNHWANTLVDTDTFTVVDRDAIATESQHNNPAFHAFVRAAPPHHSREQRLQYWRYKTDDGMNAAAEVPRITAASERESFALMIETLFSHGISFLWGLQENGIEPFEIAYKNRFQYNPRESDVPKALLEAITPLLTYPRDDSITLDDIIAAAKKDFDL